MNVVCVGTKQGPVGKGLAIVLIQRMFLTESCTTERLHFHFSLSCIGEGNGNPLQCSCLENPRDGGAWWAAVYGVAQSRTRLKRLSSSSSSSSWSFSQGRIINLYLSNHMFSQMSACTFNDQHPHHNIVTKYIFEKNKRHFQGGQPRYHIWTP